MADTLSNPPIKRGRGRPKGIHTKRVIDPSIPPYGLTPSSRISVAKVPGPRSARARRPRPIVDRTLADAELYRTGLTVSLEGTPRARPEPKNKGNKRVVNSPKKVKLYIAALERQIRTAVSNVGGDQVVRSTFGGRPLLVRIVWSFPTANEDRWGQLHLFKPDVDNLEKLVLDCLKRAGALGGDDCQVARVEKSKEWDMTGWLWVLVKPIDPNTRSPHVAKTKHEVKDRGGETGIESLASAPAWLRR